MCVLGIYPKGTGVLKICELQKGKLATVAEKESKVGFKCGTFGHSSLDNRSIATGDFNGNVQIWDLERLDVPTFSAKGHDQIINCIDGCGGLSIGSGAPELVTGSRDGCVRVWDPRVQEPVVSLEPGEGSDGARDCWTVCFGNSYNDDERVVCAGYDNGDVKMFDLRTNTMRWETNVGNGVTGMEFDRKDIEMNKLCVTTLESKFRIYDVRTQHAEDGFAFMVSSFSFCFLVSDVSRLNNAVVWNITNGSFSFPFLSFPFLFFSIFVFLQREKAHKATIWHCKHLPQNSCNSRGLP